MTKKVLATLLILTLFLLSACMPIQGPSAVQQDPTTMEGVFFIRDVTLEADELEIDLPDCGDAKMGNKAWFGNGSDDLLGETSILLVECYDRIMLSNEGTGTLTTVDGDTLLLNYAGSYIHDQGIRANYEVAGGTGRFADATGEGTIKQNGMTPSEDNTYTLELGGPIVTQP